MSSLSWCGGAERAAELFDSLQGSFHLVTSMRAALAPALHRVYRFAASRLPSCCVPRWLVQAVTGSWQQHCWFILAIPPLQGCATNSCATWVQVAGVGGWHPCGCVERSE